MKRSMLMTAAFALVLASGQRASADFVTGVTEFSTVSTGAFDGIDFWNTLSNSFPYEQSLWITTGGLNGSFINGPTNNMASINYQLPLGDTTFTVFGYPGTALSYFGLNLFFNGDNSTPGISVYAPLWNGTSGPPPYSADGASTIQLERFAPFVPGAGTLHFADVTLKTYFFADPTVFNLQRVDAFDTNPPGPLTDFVGQFTLEVSGVPEPASLILLGIGSIFAACYARRLRNRPV